MCKNLLPAIHHVGAQNIFAALCHRCALVHHRVPEDESCASTWLHAVRDGAIVIEEIGVPTHEIVVEIDQKSELTLLIVAARKDAIEVPVEGLADIVAIEAETLVERQHFPAQPIGREHRLRTFVEARGQILIIQDQTFVVANLVAEDSHAARAGNCRFFVAAFFALRDELLAFLHAQEVVDEKEFVADERGFVHKLGNNGRSSGSLASENISVRELTDEPKFTLCLEIFRVEFFLVATFAEICG